MAVKTAERDNPFKGTGLLVLLTVSLLAVRFYAARIIGWGDSEALYACYALHPQAAYLDHPGLVEMFASSIGSGTAPSPEVGHMATAMLSTAFPWLLFVVARRLGAETWASAAVALVVAATPEIAVGLFAMTPDLLLAYLWLGFLGTAALAFDAEPRSLRAAVLFSIAGVCAGVAALAKATGLLLLPVLAVTVALDPKHRRTAWPWLALVMSLLPVAGVTRFEIAHHFAMLRHRFVDTQAQAGVSLRNLGALVGGQLVYLSPIVAVLVVLVARELWRQRNADSQSRLFFWSFALPLVPLVALGLWSRVAEPHWLAPPLLALPVFAAKRGLAYSRKLVVPAVALAAALSAAVYAWVLEPSLLRYAPKSYDPKVDISNELFGWPQATRAASTMLENAQVGAGVKLDAWLVGPSWMVCAQLAAGLPEAKVGCMTDTPSDFDDWAPRREWQHADVIVFVTDDRMPLDADALFGTLHTELSSRVTILRGGRIARTFRLTLLEKRVGA